jgi:hypothetical protein
MPRTIVIIVASMMLLDPYAHKAPLRAQAPDCLNDQRIDSVTRRREAIVRARSVNTRQAQQKSTTSHYVTAEALGLTNDNGFEVRLRTGTDGYMVFIRDQTDPCSAGVFSDERGLIYEARPIR